MSTSPLRTRLRGWLADPNFWLAGLLALALVRYAFGYGAAVHSFQPLVLLAGIVLGKGLALWAGWAGQRQGQAKHRRSFGGRQ